jgi:hypothetical protein
MKVGLTEGSHCAVCFKILERQTVLDKVGHKYENNQCACGLYKDSRGLMFLKSAGGYLLSGRGVCTDTCIVVPDTYQDLPVIGVASYAFDGDTSIEKVVLPETVKSIGAEAFDGCVALREVILPDTLTDIQVRAFRECRSLVEIRIPDGVSQIMEDCFSGCRALQSVTLPKELLKIRERAFYGCTALTSLTLPASLNEIGQYAFCDCELLELSYRGSASMFQGITLGFGWNENIGSKLLKCSDGAIDPSVRV